MRLFIAAELPGEVKRKIGELIVKLKGSGAAVKWVEEENLHLTLKFIGEVGEQQLAGLVDSVEKKIGGKGSFRIELAGTGTFPEGKNPRVVWVGVSSGGDKLENLARLLGEREFASHVTIGRIKDNKGVDKLGRELLSPPLADSAFGAAEIKYISIMKSALTPQGPVYEKIKEVKL